MDAADGHSQVFEDIEEMLCRDEDVEFVVLFRSQTTEDTHQTSDIDIAVKFSDILSSNERFRKRCFLAGTLQRTATPFVDISDIEALPLDVAHDAVGGDFLCGDTQAFEAFKEAIDARFEDQRDDIRRHQRGIVERIAEDGLHG